MSGGVEQPALVDEAGDVIVALAVPDLVKLSDDGGNEVWRARLGAQAPAAPPVLTSGGDIVVVSSAGQAIGVSASGTLRFTTPLGARARGDAEVAPLALRDGGVAIAIGSTLLELDETGAIRARVALDERPTGALIEGPEGVLVIGVSGAVSSFRPPAPPRRFRLARSTTRVAAPPSPTRAPPRRRRSPSAVALDLRRSVRSDIRASVAPGGQFLDGPPAVGLGGLAYVATQTGLVRRRFIRSATSASAPSPKSEIAHRSRHLERRRARRFRGVETKPQPADVFDAAGRVAFARIAALLVNPTAR